jgi:hypothetical protein
MTDCMILPEMSSSLDGVLTADIVLVLHYREIDAT